MKSSRTIKDWSVINGHSPSSTLLPARRAKTPNLFKHNNNYSLYPANRRPILPESMKRNYIGQSFQPSPMMRGSLDPGMMERMTNQPNDWDQVIDYQKSNRHMQAPLNRFSIGRTSKK